MTVEGIKNGLISSLPGVYVAQTKLWNMYMGIDCHYFSPGSVCWHGSRAYPSADGLQSNIFILGLLLRQGRDSVEFSVHNTWVVQHLPVLHFSLHCSPQVALQDVCLNSPLNGFNLLSTFSTNTQV